MATRRGWRRSPTRESYGRESQPELPSDDEPRPRYVPDNPTALFPRGEQIPRAAVEFPQLPQIALDFLSSVPRGDYRRSIQFITQHQESLVKPSLVSLYDNEAAQSLVMGDGDRAANCIEKAIFIEITCRYKSSKDRLAYFMAMNEREPKVYDHFKSLFRRKYNQCRSKADQLVGARIHHEHSGSVGDLGRYSSAANPSRGPRQGTTVSNNPPWRDRSATGYQFLTRDMSDLSIHDERRVNSQQRRHAPESIDQSTDIAQIVVEKDADQEESSESQRGQQDTYERRGAQPLSTSQHGGEIQGQSHSGTSPPDESSQPTARPTDRQIRAAVDLTKFEELTNIKEDLSKGPGDDKVDGRYYKRSAREAGRLFRVGRVVSILTHHDYKGDPSSFRQTPDLWLSPGPKGSYILSHLSRYAVVKEGHGFCWGVPIITYNGQATRKRGLSVNEIEAHAIAYSTPRPPAELDGERKLPKLPIAIVCSEGHHLHPASRINFAKVRTIEHNVRTMDIGRVAPSSMTHFDQYWNEEMLKVWKKQH